MISLQKSVVNFLVLFLVMVSASAQVHAQQAVSFTAKDGVRVFGDYYAAANKAQPLLLLFHQAGSNRGEYTTIAPRLVKEGYNCLAIDQRSGGSRWGRTNQTVQQNGGSSSFLEALKDMQAALTWAKSNGQQGPVLLWGSSYSAALVFLLAAQHPQQVVGVLSFSPGEYLGGADTVRSAAAKVTIPVFVTSAKDTEEITQAKTILAAVASSQKRQFVPRINGVHGSSTLRQDINPKGMAENWQAVLEFLSAQKTTG
ncbi:alpha/beta hydrolase [Anthocerotibacter panamensis]|uniref:alpha/beta hydrolase n=1 Tax=Anthocerotibacter panamensis TaxID=2857077 RepID=UPI001C4027C8|nr:alpha/beta fold hydrolase [Anthocerotibacter panamensis]